MSGSNTTIGFEEIPLDWRVPGTLLEIRPDRRREGLVPFPARTLLVAPRLAAGTGATGVPLRLTRLEEAVAWAGAGSVGAHMAEAFLANNRTGNVSLFLLDDPAGARATSACLFGGAPTASGAVTLLIGGRRVSIAVSAGDAPATLATRLAAAVAANPDLPVTAAASTATCTLTAKHFGTLGNFIPLVLSPDPTAPLPAGLTLTTPAMAGGTGESTYSAAWTATAAEWWTDMVFPQLTSTIMAALPAELDRRWNAMTRLDCHAWGFAPGTFSALSTLGNARNGRLVQEMGGLNSPSPPWVWAGALAGRSAFHLLNDPARQLRGLPLVGVLPPPSASRFTDTERDLLLRDGISTFTVTDDGAVVIERIITQNQRTALGIEDVAWLDVMTSKTVSRIRYDWTAYMGLTWPRAKLADDNSPAAEFDPEVATPRRLHGSWAGRLALYERMGWVQNASESAADSLFTRDLSDRNRVNARQRVTILGNLMTLAGVLEFAR